MSQFIIKAQNSVYTQALSRRWHFYACYNKGRPWSSKPDRCSGV